MSRKQQMKKSPRKFSDKIALIKQKEAMTNACFESAIQSLSEISMDQEFPHQTQAVQQAQLFPSEKINNYVDINSKSASPSSFISNSSGYSHDSPTNRYQNQTMNKDFSDLAVNQGSAAFQNDQINFRNTFRFQGSNSSFRHSNLEGFRPDSLVKLLTDKVHSGSMPNVAMMDSGRVISHNFSGRKSDDSNRNNSEKLRLSEALSDLEDMKEQMTGKKAIMEHLKNKVVQNGSAATATHFHPHHVSPLSEDKSFILNSPPSYRRRGHHHEECVGSMNEKGFMKHYTNTSSPYMAVHVTNQPYNSNSRIIPGCYSSVKSGGHEQHNVKRVTNDWSPNHQPQTQFNVTGNEDYGGAVSLNNGNGEFKQKALTPKENYNKQYFPDMNNMTNKNETFLSLSLSNDTSENCRRVASDSSLTKTLKIHDPANVDLENGANSYQVKPEFPVPQYQRLQSLTTCPTSTMDSMDHSTSLFGAATNYQPEQNFQMDQANLQKPPATDFSTDQQRYNFLESQQISHVSSVLDRLLNVNSPDENMDPSLLETPPTIPVRLSLSNSGPFSQQFPLANTNVVDNKKVAECKQANGDLESGEQNKMCTVEEDSSNGVTGKGEVEHATCVKKKILVSQISDPSHRCWWASSKTNNNQCDKSDPSSIIPCENLDPKKVVVDPNTDFSCIPDIILNDIDVVRRDSFNWTDEILSNLNQDPTTTGAAHQLLNTVCEEENVMKDSNI